MSKQDQHWTDRLKANMDSVVGHAQKYAANTAPVIGALHTMSNFLHVSSVALAAMTIDSAPTVAGAASGVAAVTLVSNKALKQSWEYVLELKEVADNYNLDPEEAEALSVKTMDEAKEKIKELIQEKEELLSIVSDQMDASDKQQASIQTLSTVVEQNGHIVERLLSENRNVTEALEHLLKERKAGKIEEESKASIREAYSVKYNREIEKATNEGLIDPGEFDPDKDEFIKIEGNEASINSDDDKALSQTDPQDPGYDLSDNPEFDDDSPSPR